MSYLDRDGNGYVTQNDFNLMAYQAVQGVAGQINSTMAFRALDRDGNGVLTANEVVGGNPYYYAGGANPYAAAAAANPYAAYGANPYAAYGAGYPRYF